MSIRVQIERLAKLQAVENDIRDINRLLEKIPEELEGLGRQLKERSQALEQAENKIDTLEKQYRAWESDSQSISAKAAKEEDKLRAVKNNKEYQALLAGIDHLKTDRSEIEDRMIETLESIDDAKEYLSREKDDFGRLEARLSRQRETIKQRAAREQQQLKAFETSKASLVDDIEPNILARFHDVQNIKGGGLAVAAVQNALCKGCNMNIPPQLYIELQRYDRLVVCPNCQRIIYHDEADESDG